MDPSKAKRPEILAPAGDFIALQAAIDAGADAVYFGLDSFNMRLSSGVNFVKSDLPEIARRCGGRVKRYLTLNSIMFEGETSAVEDVIVAAKPHVDAFIVSDWGVVSLLKKHGARFHVSTQMSTSNSLAVRFLLSQGASRVVLARECTLGEVRRIVEATGAEIECFVHGAQCVAESGRCFMSHDVFGKSACRGECVQPCRRKFKITAVDLYSDGNGNPVHKESRARYEVEPRTILSAKDLCSIGFVDKLVEAGVASFKIEGRARNANYVKTCVEAYKEALDLYFSGRYSLVEAARLRAKLETVFHREFSDGLYFGRPGLDQFADSENSLATSVKRHIGIVLDYYAKAGVAEIKIQDHALAAGDRIQIHGNTTGVVEMVAVELRNDAGPVSRAERGEWVTVRTPRCRAGDKVFFVEKRGAGKDGRECP